MTAPSPNPAYEPVDEVSTLIDLLHRTSTRIEELTGGEVDVVTDRQGRPFLLRHAQEHLRRIEEAKQAAILNALPAHVAVLDAQGRIVSVNEPWRAFGRANSLRTPDSAVGRNYLETCERATGGDASEAREICAGIKSVLTGREDSFAAEYSCHAPETERWFLMTATPLSNDLRRGAVIMHVNVTERKAAEEKIVHLSRVYAMLSGINTLIVRVRDRDELFKEACRIAVTAGGFRMALIAVVDPETGAFVPVASGGKDDGLVAEVTEVLSHAEIAPTTMVATAIREKRPVVANDSLNDPRLLLSARYAASAVRSIAILPLLIGGEAVGGLALYSSEVGFFHSEEMKLLAELANDIAFCMGSIRARAHKEKADEALRASLREKEALLKEVHHRVKNNLQVITSLLRLEANRIDHPTTRNVLKDMQNRILAMASLHEALYRSNNFAQVDLGSYLKELTTQLKRSLMASPGQIRFHLELLPVGLDLDQAVPCGLIVNELVSNALKHGFPDGRHGEIRVEAEWASEGLLRLRISDDGIGLSPDFAEIRVKSLGLQLVADLARQLGGSLFIGPGPEAVFEVSFRPDREDHR